MNIGFLFLHPPNESMGSLYRIRNFCRGLSNNGHKCIIFSPYIYLENWGSLVKFISFSFLDSMDGTLKRVYKIIRKILDIPVLSRYTLLNPHIFNLTISQLSKDLLNKINNNSYNLDVIIGESEMGGLILIQIKDKLKIPIIVDYQNYWPEELIEHKILKRNCHAHKFLINLENKVIKEADFIITISEYLEDFLAKISNNIFNSKIRTVNNGGKPFLNKPLEKKPPIKIINSGLVVQRSNFTLFLNSIPYILEEYPKTQIYITKRGEKLKETIKIAKKLKIKVNFYWKKTIEEYLEFLSQCHIGVVTSTYDLTRKLGFVAKIYDYFSVGIPVVGNDIGGWTSIIAKEKVGLLSSNDPRDLAEKIIEIIENPEKANEYGKNGIRLLKEKLSIEGSTQKLLNYIENAIRNRSDVKKKS